MAKLRLIFVKEGRAVYISHLDLLRTFQRVFIRCGLVLRHSQGFHPHPLISFALPLSVGQASDWEALDFETDGDMDGGGLPERMNPFMPEGIRAVQCAPPVHPVRELKAIRARIELIYDGGVPAGAAERVRGLLTGETLLVDKRTKRKTLEETDVRPMLLDLAVREEGELLVLEALTEAQNPGLNPALLASAVARHLPELTPDFVRVRRLALLCADGSRFQ